MLSLPNNCRAGSISVFPSNWKTVRASVKSLWRISYWFYDDNINVRKKVVIKGMNMISCLKERQEAVEALIEDELYELQELGLNRISGHYTAPVENEVSASTYLPDALEWAIENIKVERDTRIDMKSSMKYMMPAMSALRYNQLQLKDVKKKHIKLILEKTGKLKVQTNIPVGKTGRFKKGIWSANQFNHYRTCLGMLFGELMEYDAIEYNPALQVKKDDHVEKIRDTLTDEQRQLINKHLFDNNYSFWRFLHIFFHSGSRIIEILRVRKGDVDLKNQRFKVLVKKGGKHKEEWRVIKDSVTELWQQVMNSAKENDYLFSTSVLPGPVMIRREQITTRWKRHVKDKLKVTADFYSLKHTNLDEVAELLGLKAAQEAAGHATPVVTLKYTKGEINRKQNRLKQVDNSFA